MGRLVFFFATLLFLTSCYKEEKIRYDFAGVWNFTNLETSWHSNNKLDSTFSETDLGTWVMADNASSQYNNLHYTHSKTPPQSFINFSQPPSLNYSEGYTSWYSDFSTRTRLTLTEPLDIGSSWVIYSVLELKRNKMVLQYVLPDNSNSEYISYKEVMTFERY